MTRLWYIRRFEQDLDTLCNQMQASLPNHKLLLHCTYILQGLPGHAAEEAQCLTILSSFAAGNSQMPNQ